MHHPNSRSVADRPSVSSAGRAVRWALCTVAVAATFYLLAFGVAVLLGVPPTQRGHGFWRPEKFVYGLLPVFATPTILAITVRSWIRLFARKRNAWLTVCAVAVFAVPLDTIVFLKTAWAAGRKNPLGLAERIICLQLGNRGGQDAGRLHLCA
jgi:hypothetical protein